MRISDWSSDVCSSDLGRAARPTAPGRARGRPGRRARRAGRRRPRACRADRKSVVKGKSVSVRVDLGGRRIIKKKNTKHEKKNKIKNTVRDEHDETNKKT